MRKRPELVGQTIGPFGLFQNSVMVEEAIDITSECPRRPPTQSVLLLYARTPSGVGVQVVDCYEGQDYGVATNWLVETLNDLLLPECRSFLRSAKSFGLTPEILRGLIRENLPIYAPAVV